jgi:DUF917 family protein
LVTSTEDGPSYPAYAAPVTLGEPDLEALARGCAIFGGGGGGDPTLGHIMAREAVRRCGPVALVDLDELPDDGLVLPVAMVGAPMVIEEKIPNGSEGKRIQVIYERLFGRPVVALAAAELGGIEGMLPVAWAAHAGLPLADCDLMGRAFPEIHMCTPTLHGLPIGPVVVTDERGNVATFTSIDAAWAERLVRPTCAAMGNCASLAIFPMTAARAREVVVRGSVSRAIRLGQLLGAGAVELVTVLEAELGAVQLIEGKVADVERWTTEGFARGSAVIEGFGDDAGRLLRLEFQNENLLALLDGEPVALVPDVITVLDQHGAGAVVSERLRYGQRVTVIAFPCHPVWRTVSGLRLVGPRAWGYDLDYVPVERIHATRA